MGLKKRIKYKWKLFFPLTLLLCFIIGTLLFFLYKHNELTSNMLFIILGLFLFSIALIFYASWRLSKSVTLLQKFTDQIANNETPTITAEQFPSDEIGDIFKQVVRIYADKGIAVEKSEQEHHIAKHATEEKSRIKRQLTNNINHELKTPIGIIKGYIDTILEDPNMDADTQRYFIKQTQQHVARLCALLNDISTITRLDEATIIPTDEVNFHDIVYSISNDIKAMSITDKMSFNHNIPLTCIVKANQGLLNEALLNLISNAATYSHGTEMGLIFEGENADYYNFSFYDNGVGVDEKHLAHLFDRFFRIDVGRSRRTGGTGLGLPIVKNTIKSFGGDITVRNRAEGGLEFRFTIPKWKQGF